MSCLPHFLHDANGLIEQDGAFSVQPGPPARQGHVLAGGAKSDHVHRRQLRAVQGGNISKVANLGETLRRDTDGKGLYLGVPYRLYACQNTAQLKAAGA